MSINCVKSKIPEMNAEIEEVRTVFILCRTAAISLYVSGRFAVNEIEFDCECQSF